MKFFGSVCSLCLPESKNILFIESMCVQHVKRGSWRVCCLRSSLPMLHMFGSVHLIMNSIELLSAPHRLQPPADDSEPSLTWAFEMHWTLKESLSSNSFAIEEEEEGKTFCQNKNKNNVLLDRRRCCLCRGCTASHSTLGLRCRWSASFVFSRFSCFWIICHRRFLACCWHPAHTDEADLTGKLPVS